MNDLVVMETVVPCYSPGDVLICYICSLGQQKSDIRKFPLVAGYVVDNLSLSIVIQINLSRLLKCSTRYCFTCTALWDDGHTLQQREVKHGLCRA